MRVLSIRIIVLSCFYLPIFYLEKFSTWIRCLPFTVYMKLKLSNVSSRHLSWLPLYHLPVWCMMVELKPFYDIYASCILLCINPLAWCTCICLLVHCAVFWQNRHRWSPDPGVLFKDNTSSSITNPWRMFKEVRACWIYWCVPFILIWRNYNQLSLNRCLYLTYIPLIRTLRVGYLNDV